jgi:LmbE family N-acetylglucosaminyl deacetylase
MLGTIMKYEDTTFDVLCLSSGGAKGFDVTNEQDRRKEVENLWKRSRCKNVNVLFSDCDYLEDKTEPEWINHIENLFMKFTDYDCLMIPPEKDSMYEHRFVNKFGAALIRKSAISLIEYHTVSTLNCWKPNLFVDMGYYYNKKSYLLQKFESQMGKSYFTENTLEAFHSNFQSRKRGIKLVEQFKTLEVFEG